MLIFTIVTIGLSLLSLLSPNGRSKLGEKQEKFKRKSIVTIIKNSIYNIYITFKNWRSEEYLPCWIFLFSYVFFSAPGTIITIYVTPLFIDIYKLDLDQVSSLNLYYKIAMVVGIIIGMIIEKIIKFGDVYKIVIQTILFQAILCSIYICITFKVSYTIVMLQTLLIGLLYSWNISVARGLMVYNLFYY